MPNGVDVNVQIDERKLNGLIEGLAQESDGATLRRQLAGRFRGIARTAVPALQGAIVTMGSMHQSAQNRYDPQPIREAIANSIDVETSLSARSKFVGASIVQHRRGMPHRGKNVGTSTLWRAGKVFNSGSKGNKAGWFHPTFGHGPMVLQVTRRPGWFDETFKPFKPSVRKAVEEAVEQMLDRIARKG